MSNFENILDILKHSLILRSRIIVSSTLIPEMEVYGFIPLFINNDTYLNTKSMPIIDFNMSNTIIVSNRLAITYTDYVEYGNNAKMDRIRIVHPILNIVQLQNNSKKYEIPLKTLYIPKYMDKIAYTEFRKAVVYTKSDYSLCKLEGISVNFNNNSKRNEYYYSPNNDEFLFCDIQDQIKAVGNSFAVLCRHVNQVTGCLSYELFNPQDLILSK